MTVGGMRLYSGPLSMFGAKVQIAALEKRLEFELVMVPFDMSRGYEPKHSEVIRINPKRQVPVLVHDGLELFDSTQIFEYLEDLQPDPPLWPRDRRDRARARLLEHMSDEVYFPNVIRLMGLQAALADPAAIAARDACERFYRDMETRLADCDFLGGSLSYADIAFYMSQLFGERMGAAIPDDAPKLLAWRERMTARAAVAEVAGSMATYLISIGRPAPYFLMHPRPEKNSTYHSVLP